MTPSFWRRIPGNWIYLLRIFARRPKDDVDAELRFHFDERITELTAQGVSADAARTQALDEFGDVSAVRKTLEEIDDRMARSDRCAAWWESVVQDLHYVLRSLRRSPTFVISATLTLALGLGANAALFSVLDRLYLQAPAGVAAPDHVKRMYLTYESKPGDVRYRPVLSPPEYLAIAAAIPPGNKIVGFRTDLKMPFGKTDDGSTVNATWVLGDYFATIGVAPIAGRPLTADEVGPKGSSPVAVVSSSFARTRFGAVEDALNKEIDIGTLHFTIVGVMPEGFSGTELDPADVWAPMNVRGAQYLGTALWYEQSHTAFIRTTIRVANDGSLASLATIVAAAVRPVSMSQPASSVAIQFGSIREALMPGSNDSERAIATRLAVVAFAILLIACANVANLLLARALQRRREIGVRLALGVSRGRLISQLLTESVVLAAIAGVAALIVAVWTATALRSALLPNVQWGASAIGVRAIAFGAVTTLVAGLLAGLAPALHASRPNLTSVLRGGSRDGSSTRSSARGTLLVAQIALSCVLLAGAGLFVRSLHQVEAVDIGYDTQRVVFAGINFTASSGRKPEELPPLLADAASRIGKLPGVESVAFTQNRPMWSISFIDAFLPNGDTLRAPKDVWNAVSIVSPGYFATMGMRVLEGRDIAEQDRAGSELVLVVNSNFAKAIWPGESAVGKCFRLHKPTDPCRRVIGVVTNAHFSSVLERPSIQYYAPIAQENGNGQSGMAGAMEIRTSPGRADAVAAQVKQLLVQMSGSGMKPWTQTLAEQLDGSFRSWRLGAALFTAAGLLALLVAAVGIYGTIAYTFSQRTQEIGVRIALGAQGSSIIALVLKSSVAIAAIGVVIGTSVALWAGKFAKPLLYETTPNNPFVLGGVALVLLGVAVVASLVPAIRAKSVDPLEALRAE